MKHLAILDYGLGNIRSLYNAIKVINSEVNYYSEIKNKNFDILFIPGVGSFNKASKIFKDQGYLKIIKKANSESVKIIGICLGMHILFSEGFEDGRNIGLANNLLSIHPIYIWMILFSVIWLLHSILLTYFSVEVLDPGRINILLAFEVVVGFLSAGLLTDEIISYREYIGAIFVVSACFIDVFTLKKISAYFSK